MRMIALSVMGVLAGCASSEPPAPIPSSPPPLNLRVAPSLGEATPIQTSRYVLERRSPASELTDILNVPVDVRLPAMDNLTVKDGLDFLLKGSGMRLRTPTSYGEAQMYEQPLPLTHMNMGLIPLRQSLQVLGGQAFELEEDVVKREVGFRLKSGYVWTPPKYDGVLASPQLDKALLANRTKTASSEINLDWLVDDVAVKPGHSRVKAAVSKTVNGPTTLIKTQSKADSLTSVAKKREAMSLPFYNVVKGERYRDALLRWVHRDGFERMALAQEPEFLAAMESRASSEFSVRGSLRKAVVKLASEVPELASLTVYENQSQSLVALHPYRTEPVKAFVTQGDTLEEVVSHTVKQYDWNWNDATSWTVDNYGFGSEYPMVTRHGDISSALSILLKQYPLEARRLDATRTIYIREATPL